MRERGYGPAAMAFRHLPAAVAKRGYALLVRAPNRLINAVVNRRRLSGFRAESGTPPGRLFYVIVMPRTLHFLLPCLALLPRTLTVELLVNGAARWECEVLRERFPHLRQLRLATLPGSSQMHGDMLDLMLAGTSCDFGILDHDMYVFDSTLFDRLEFAPGECMLAALKARSERAALDYPLTHLLYFNSAMLRDLMSRHRVNANTYRSAPPRLQGLLDSIGLYSGTYLKDYHSFFDTLNLLLALAYAEGRTFRQVDPRDPDGVHHIGGTSIGTFETKELDDLYIHASFIELVDDARVTLHYARLIAPFRSAAAIRERLRADDRVMHVRDTVDALRPRLEARTRQSA